MGIDRTVAEFSIAYVQRVDPEGRADALPGFATDAAELRRMYRMMVLRAAVRHQGDQPAAHRQARHLPSVHRPRGHACRRRRGDAPRGRAVPRLPRDRHPVLARRHAARHPALLGRRRARHQLRRPARRLPVVRADRLADAACRRRGHGLQDPRRAALRARLHRRRRHVAGRVLRGASTWPARGACRWSS